MILYKKKEKYSRYIGWTVGFFWPDEDGGRMQWLFSAAAWIYVLERGKRKKKGGSIVFDEEECAGKFISRFE